LSSFLDIYIFMWAILQSSICLPVFSGISIIMWAILQSSICHLSAGLL